MNSRPAHLLIPIFAAHALAHAETPATPAAAATADFTAGLKQLADLGLPAAPGAKWVAVGPMVSNQLLQSRSGGFDQDAYRVREILGSASDHLWFIPAPGDATPSVVMPGSPGIRPVEFDARMFGGAPGMADMMRKQSLTQLQKAPAAKLAEDIAGLIDRWDKKLAEARKSRGDGENYWAEQQESALGGRMLVFAAQVYRAGEPVAANTLAAAVFKNFPKREVVLNAAISTLADQGYFDACETLKKDADWARYAKSLKELQTKFPRGWENRPAVAKLAALAVKRAGTAPGVPPAAPGADAATLAALRALDAVKPASVADAPADARDSLWVLPALPEKPAGGFNPMFFGGGGSEILGVPEVKALTRSGFAALPTLAAAVGDETLTTLFTTNNGRSYSSNETPEAKTKRLFEELRRPMTRGEIVRALLSQILPGEEYKLRRLDADAFAETVESFRAEHAKDTPSALAAFYLKDGSHQQKRSAMRYLARSEDPAAAKVFEDSLLESEDIEGRLNEAQEYLRAKRAKASGFAQKLISKLRENLALPDKRPAGENSSRSSNGVTRLSRVGLEKQIKAVEAFASGKPVRELLLESVAKPAKEAMPLLQAQLQSVRELPLAERVPLLLEVACAAREPEPKFLLVGQMSGFNPFGAESKEKYAVPAPGSPDAKRWLTLFDDEKTAGSPGYSLGLVAASGFEMLCETPPRNAMFAQRNSDKPADSIFLRRARARLAGTTIPAYPDPTKVSAERLKAILDAVATTPDEKLEAHLAGLNDDERAAWTVWWALHLSPESASYLQVALPEVTAPAVLKEREKRLSSVFSNEMTGQVTEEDKLFTKTLLAAVGLAPGDAVDAARIDAVCAFLAKDAAKHSGSSLTIARGRSSLGFTPYAHREKIVSAEKLESSYGMISSGRVYAMQLRTAAQRFTMDGDYGVKGADAVVILQMPVAGASGNRVWRVKDGKVTAPAALDASVAGATPQFAQIIVLTAKDAAVVLPQSKDADGNAVEPGVVDLSGEDEE